MTIENEGMQVLGESPTHSMSEQEETYDKNAADPRYKLFTLRSNSCLDYQSIMKLQ